MNNKGFYLIILLSIFFIISCSSVPKPVSHKFTTQKKLEATHHWQILAKDFAEQFALIVKDDNVAGNFASPIQFGHAVGNEPTDSQSPSLSVGNYPYIYIQTNDVSAFGKAFRNNLITELIGLGYHIAYSPHESAAILRWSVQKVYHNANRIASGFPGSKTLAVALGYGVYKVFDHNSADEIWGWLAGAAVLDLADNGGGIVSPSIVPPTEIILTITLSKDTIIHARKSQSYYVNAEDFNHYANIPDYSGQESYLKPVKFKVTNY